MTDCDAENSNTFKILGPTPKSVDPDLCPTHFSQMNTPRDIHRWKSMDLSSLAPLDILIQPGYHNV